MSIEGINIFSKKFVESYVTTALYEAGEYLKLTPNEEALNRATQDQRVNSKYRPIILNYQDRSWNWSSRSTVIHPSTPSTSQVKPKEEQDKESALHALIVGVMAIFIGAGLFGYAYQNYSRQKEASNYTNAVIDQFAPHIQNPEKAPIVEKIHELLKCQDKIDKIHSSRVNKYALAALGILVGGATLATGGYAMVPWMMTAGVVTLVASTALGLFTFFYHWNDQRDISEQYRKIVGSTNPPSNGIANEILFEYLPFYNEFMQDMNVCFPPQYRELYSEYQYIPPNTSAPPLNS